MKKSLNIIATLSVHDYVNNYAATEILLKSYQNLCLEFQESSAEIDVLKDEKGVLAIEKGQAEAELATIKGHIVSPLILFAMSVIGIVFVGYGINILSSNPNAQSSIYGWLFLIGGGLVNFGSFAVDRIFNYGIKKFARKQTK